MLKNTRFCNLSGKNLSTEEKFDMVKRFRDEQINDSSLSSRRFSVKHGLSPSTFDGWRKAFQTFEETGVLMNDARGRPKIIDKVGSIGLKRKLSELTESQKTPGKADFKELVLSTMVETKERKGLTGGSPDVSNGTLRLLQKELGVEVKRQFKPRARMITEFDPRNTYTMFALAKAFCTDLPSPMIFNWDSTHFAVQANPEATGVCIKVEFPRKQAVTAESTLGFNIKLYHFHHSSGYRADAVFLVADESMEADDFVHHQVVGLSTSNQLGAIGYLCFTKTGCCNQQFCRWFGTNIIAPFVSSTRSYCMDNAPVRAFVCCDAEAKQLEVFQEADMLQLLSANLIDFAKTPAFCSVIGQSSEFLKTVRKELEELPADMVSIHQATKANTYREMVLDRRLQPLLAERIHYSTKQRSHILDAIHRIVWTVRATLFHSVVCEGYTSLGLSPLDFDVAMSKCGRSISPLELEVMKEKVAEIAEMYRTRGVVTEEELDAAGIVKAANKRQVPKDQHVLYQQRAVVINSAAFVAKCIEMSN